jgi:predicted acylesterase/phospholipase RssA
MTRPLKLQIALQGGGARIAELLAAAEAFKNLERDGVIEVTRIAGTSAGAIVGALWAASVDLNQVRLDLAGEVGASLMKTFRLPSSRWEKLSALWKMKKGQPLWDQAHLREWLIMRFKEVSGTSLLIEKLKPEFIAISTSLNGYMPVHHTNGDVVTALLASSGLPFMFRTWEGKGQAINVDGGLCDNLPVGVLSEDEDAYGRVVACSFSSGWPTVPTNGIEFAAALLSVAINRAVEVARARIGEEFVVEADAGDPISTFDFAKARKFLASSDYGKTVEKVYSKAKSIVDRIRYEVTPNVLGDVWTQKKNRDLTAFMQRIGKIYRTQHEGSRFKYKSMSVKVEANGLTDSPYPDEIVYVLVFQPDTEPMFAHRLSLSSPVGQEFFGKYIVELQNDAGEAVPIEVIPILEEETGKLRELVVFFSSPLTPGSGPYHLSLMDHGINVLAGLCDPEKRSDYVEVALARVSPSERVETVNIVIHIPEKVANVEPERMDEVTPIGRKMTDKELRNAFGYPKMGFKAVGWVAEKFEPIEKIKVQFKQQ